ncbi:MAG: hypothetical protein HY675_26500 [Chloroflexi bacterium]|nr:hypothetical protein [Chloroflexota bacterium]
MAMFPPRRWDDVRNDLRSDWDRTYLAYKRPWEEVQDDVRFGWEQGSNPRYLGAKFEDVEDELQKLWETSFPHARFEDWRYLKEAVRLGFDRAKQEHGETQLRQF